MNHAEGSYENIPDPSVRRLSAYLRQLEQLTVAGVQHVSSKQLAEYIKAGDAQVRRDLALFGQFGRRGVGYDVRDLVGVIRTILGTTRQWGVIVVGAGPLAQALLRYDGFSRCGFDLVAAFDVDPEKVGSTIGEAPVFSMSELEKRIAQLGVRLAILTVPADVAQETVDRLTAAGVEGILNFTTGRLEPPKNAFLSQVDITAHLEQLSFQVSSSRP